MIEFTAARAGWTAENITAAIGILIAAGGLITIARKASHELEDLDIARLTVAGWIVTIAATVCGLVAGGVVFFELQDQRGRAKILFALIAGFDLFAVLYLGCRWIFGLLGFSMLKELPSVEKRPAHVLLEEHRNESDC